MTLITLVLAQSTQALQPAPKGIVIYLRRRLCLQANHQLEGACYGERMGEMKFMTPSYQGPLSSIGRLLQEIMTIFEIVSEEKGNCSVMGNFSIWRRPGEYQEA